MKAVYCLDCDRRIVLSNKAEVGDVITCPNCDSEFEIINMRPPEIEWLYDDDDDYDDYEELDSDESGDEETDRDRAGAGQRSRRRYSTPDVFDSDWDE